MATSGSPLLALRDRAVAVLRSSEPLGERELLEHVYGGQVPAPLHTQLLQPLREDPRLRRLDDGRWTVAGAVEQRQPLQDVAFTALALTTTGPNPARGRILRLSALHIDGAAVVERFSVTVNPGQRVPRYVAKRVGSDPEVLNDLPSIAEVFEDFERFLAARPVCAQEAALAWSFVSAEARRIGRAMVEPTLLDVNNLATELLELRGKPSLGLVAQHLGISFTRLEAADEEARIVSLVIPRLLRLAAERGEAELGGLAQSRGDGPLRTSRTSREMPDEPGIYVMRDESRSAVYVGKARRLRSRLAAYVYRPLGPTRRLEGLVDAVQAVDAETCQTDLEALVLEDRAIRALQPRFNTVRRQRLPRIWIRRPPQPVDEKRARARLELSSGPDVSSRGGTPRDLQDDDHEIPRKLGMTSGTGEYVGPFRNEAAADAARTLAREVFQLDVARRTDRVGYVEQLERAWRFLNGSIDDALDVARAHHASAVARGDDTQARQWQRRLAAVLEYDLSALLLPSDPRTSRYAVVRPGPNGTEVFIVDGAVFVGFETFDGIPTELPPMGEPRTTADDQGIVLRWLGMQRPPAQVIALPDDPDAALDLIAEAALL